MTTIPHDDVERGVLWRAAVVAACLLLGAVAIARGSRTEAVPPREAFATFPMQIGDWQGQPANRFDQQTLAVLGVDDYVNRVYTGPGGATVGVYIGFYQSQRQGDTIHSPLNCLPGAGWEPVDRSRIPIAVRTSSSPAAPTRTIVVNRMIIQRGLDRQLALYWYQSHGRVVASEYWGKFYTVLDSVRLHRTDAAMIRVLSPIGGSDAAAEQAASQAAVDVAQAVFPLLGRYLPE